MRDRKTSKRWTPYSPAWAQGDQPWSLWAGLLHGTFPEESPFSVQIFARVTLASKHGERVLKARCLPTTSVSRHVVSGVVGAPQKSSRRERLTAITPLPACRDISLPQILGEAPTKKQSRTRSLTAPWAKNPQKGRKKGGKDGNNPLQMLRSFNAKLGAHTQAHALVPRPGSSGPM
jgi:hypothetical protein